MTKPKLKGDRFWVSLPIEVDAILRSRAKREGRSVGNLVENQMCQLFGIAQPNYYQPVEDEVDPFTIPRGPIEFIPPPQPDPLQPKTLPQPEEKP